MSLEKVQNDGNAQKDSSKQSLYFQQGQNQRESHSHTSQSNHRGESQQFSVSQQSFYPHSSYHIKQLSLPREQISSNLQKKQLETFLQRSYLLDSSKKRNEDICSASMKLDETTNQILTNNSMISDSIKKQKQQNELPQLYGQLQPQSSSGIQVRVAQFSPTKKSDDSMKRSLFHFSSSNQKQQISFPSQIASPKLNIFQNFGSKTHQNLNNFPLSSSTKTLPNTSSYSNIPFSLQLNSMNLMPANESNISTSSQPQTLTGLQVMIQSNQQIASNLNNSQSSLVSPSRSVLPPEIISNRKRYNIRNNQKSCGVLPSKEYMNTASKEQQINGQNSTHYQNAVLSTDEKEQLEKFKQGGLINYVKSIYFDCEYIFRPDLDKQMIFLSNVNPSKKISNINRSPQKYDFLHINLEEMSFKPKEEELQDEPDEMKEEVNQIRKECEMKLCKAIAMKKAKGKDKINSIQSILIENLVANFSLIKNQSISNSLKETFQALLALQNKRHMVVENEKRELMLEFLKREKTSEETFNIELFGKEEDVESFRFKLGEIYVENNKLVEEIKGLREKNITLEEQLVKQKKMVNLIKNEYTNVKEIQLTLQKRLQQKYESYYKRFTRQDGIENLKKNQSQMKDMSPRKVNFRTQKSKIMNNYGGNAKKPKGSICATPLSRISINTPKSQDLDHAQLAEASLNFANMVESVNKREKFQSQEEEESDCDSFEDCADIEKILMEVRGITKVSNNDVMIKEVQEDIPVFYFSQETQTDPKLTEFKLNNAIAIQTNLSILDSKFDHIMNNDRLIELSKQEQIKEQLQNLSVISANEDLNQSDDDGMKQEYDENYPNNQDALRNSVQVGNKGEDNTNISNKEEEETKQIDKKINMRISVINILKGLPIEKRKKKIEKNDIQALTDNISQLKNFLQTSSSPCRSETSILINDMQDEVGIKSILKSKQPSKILNNVNKTKKVETPSTTNSKSKVITSNKVQITRFSPQKESSNDAMNSTTSNNLALLSNNKNNNNNNRNNNSRASVSKTLIQIGNGNSITKQKKNSDTKFTKDQPLSTVPSSSQIEQDISLKRGFSYEQSEDLREQILSIIKLYNLETEKSKNYEESIDQLLKILQELFAFCYKIFSHVQKTQKDTYKSVVEQFFQTFTSIRWKLPQEIDQKLEEDLYPERALKKKLAAKKKQLQGSLANAPRAQGILFSNLRQATKLSIQDKFVHPGIVLTKKLREAGLPKKFNGYLPLKTVMKQISGIIEERARQITEQRIANDTELSIFVFNKFLHQYGFKNVAEQKFLHFLMNILSYQQIFRVQIFGKLTSVMQRDQDNYSVDEMDKYMCGWQFLLYQSNMGWSITNNEADLRVFCHYLRCLDYLKQKMEKFLSSEQILELKQFIENNKENDNKTSNSTNSGKCVVDVDSFMYQVMERYRIIINQTKISVRNAFLACDLDGNGTINLNEFLTLFRHIQTDRFSFGKVCKMFDQTADIISFQEKCLSFQKFTALCLQEQLFKETAQRKFIGIYEKSELEGLFLELRTNWQQEKQILSDKIEQLKPFVQIETYKIWKEVLLVLQERIMKNQSTLSAQEQNNIQQYQQQTQENDIFPAKNNQDTPSIQQLQSEYQVNTIPILIAHKLLKQELIRLLDVGQTEDLNFNDIDDDSDSDDQESQQNISEDQIDQANKEQNPQSTENQLGTPTNKEDESSNQAKLPHQKLRDLKYKDSSKNIEIIDAQIYQFSDEQVVKENLGSQKKQQNLLKQALKKQY